jgi:hypothetical protein
MAYFTSIFPYLILLVLHCLFYNKEFALSFDALGVKAIGLVISFTCLFASY